MSFGYEVDKSRPHHIFIQFSPRLVIIWFRLLQFTNHVLNFFMLQLSVLNELVAFCSWTRGKLHAAD